MLLQVYAIRQLVQLMKSIKSNIDALSAGDADLVHLALRNGIIEHTQPHA